ncbi:MAG: HNH endonuclease signature motif containing protein [Pyrinomonadaceae bacterium]
MAKLSSASLRKKVLKRANGLCEYCRLPQSYSAPTFELDHIHPISKGSRTIQMMVGIKKNFNHQGTKDTKAVLSQFVIARLSPKPHF